MYEALTFPTLLCLLTPIPFASDILDGVFPGKAILVKGNVLSSSAGGDHRFTIDLCCGILVNGDHRDDKALHINPRFDSSGVTLYDRILMLYLDGKYFRFSKADRDIVLNSLINNTWGVEQRLPNPLERGKPFSIRILILRDYFKVSVNGKHLSDFVHRVPLEKIKCIYVHGCIDIELIEYQGTRPSFSPPPSAPSIGSSDDSNEPIEIAKPVHRIC
uniref:Galectin n=1 Tax=Globodera pallida TaxID=36090 RepID=A0A183BLM1_GLOPA